MANNPPDAVRRHRPSGPRVGARRPGKLCYWSERMARELTAPEVYAFALRDLPGAVDSARREGLDIAQAVYVHFDTSRHPGFGFAVARLVQTTKKPRDQVEELVRAELASAGDEPVTAGRFYPLGEARHFLRLMVKDVTPPAEPAPRGMAHVVAIAGAEGLVDLAPIDITAKA